MPPTAMRRPAAGHFNPPRRQNARILVENARAPEVRLAELRSANQKLPVCLLIALVPQYRCAGNVRVDARNGAQILVDGADIVFRHVLINGPGHYLQDISVERRQKAAAVRSSAAVWMDVIVILSCAQDGKELLKTATSFGAPGLVWS